jgi:hypothetical protein
MGALPVMTKISFMKLVKTKFLKRILVLFALVLVLRVYIGLYQNAFIDDAFITFQYARNLRTHQTWGFYPGITTNTATSPLNVLLTALFGIIIPDLVTAAIWLAVIESILLVGILLLISENLFQNFSFGILASIAILTNPLLVSTLGLETLLFILFVLVNIFLYIRKKWFLLAVALALLVLTRPDGILLFFILFWFVGEKNRKLSSKIKFIAIFGLCLLPWYLFSWIHLGSFFPDTLLLKVNQNWNGLHYIFGIGLYLYKYPLQTIFALIWSALGIYCLITERHQIPPALKFLLIFGWTYFLAYSFLRVPPYHWYYAPVAISLNLVGIWSLTNWLQNMPEHKILTKKIRQLILIIVMISSIGVIFWQSSDFPPSETPIHSNWATQQQYQEIGNWLKHNLEPGVKIKLNGEIGTLAFYSEHRLLDMFSCRYEQQLKVNQLLQQNGLARIFARINFFWFDPGEPCWPTEYLLGFDQRRTSHQEELEVLMEWPIFSNWSEEKRVVLWVLEERD